VKPENLGCENLKHALDRINIEHPGILKEFGGHAMAAGMTIDRVRLDEFKEALERVCRDEIAPDLPIKRLRHDGEFPADHVP
jgi:single-stranded-DNA-specific exonuclease